MILRFSAVLQACSITFTIKATIITGHKIVVSYVIRSRDFRNDLLHIIGRTDLPFSYVVPFFLPRDGQAFGGQLLG